jgi:hypothetical protein
MHRCDGVGIPEHISRVLFFFHRLQRFIELHGISMYVVPTKNLKLSMSRSDKHKVVGVYEVMERHFVPLDPEDDTSGAGGRFVLGSAIRKRSRHSDGENRKERLPFSIRLAFTGAFYKHAGVNKQMLFTTAIVTPLQNFDMLAYIMTKFLVPPKILQKEIQLDYAEILFCWKQILMYEAATNFGLVGDPCEHMIEPSGELGVFTLTSLLSAPLRMAEWLQRHHGDVTDIQIIGMPKLSYHNDEMMNEYVKYMHESLNEQGKAYANLQCSVDAFNTAGEKDEKGSMEFRLDAPGGWPLKSIPLEGDSRHTFIRFGIFPLPLVMRFKIHRLMSNTISFNSFQSNLGKLPKSVEKKARDFLTCEPVFEDENDDDEAENDDMGDIPDDGDDHILTEKATATPLLIIERFYSKGAPLKDLQTQGMMLPWFYGMQQKMQSERVRGLITATAGMDMLHKHIQQCLSHHVGALPNGVYSSFHLEQMFELVRRADETPLKTVRVEDYWKKLRNQRVNQRIRHCPYLSMSVMHWLSFSDINRQWRSSATNLECIIEVLNSSVHYLLDSHSTTYMGGFSGCLQVMNGRGHYLLQTNGQTVDMEWRKQNTSGLGFVQERINSLMDMLCVYYGISRNENRQLFVTNNRFTDVALENQLSAESINGEIVSNPEKELNDQPQLIPESRAANYTSLIKLGFPRDGNDDTTVSTSTADPKKTNERVSVLKVCIRANFGLQFLTKLTFVILRQKKVFKLPLVAIATNQSRSGDEPHSMYVVLHAVVPGAQSYKRIEAPTGDPNDVSCDISEGRATNPEEGPRRDLLVKTMVMGGPIGAFAKLMVALPHRSGMLPFHISWVSSAYLDWLNMLIKRHAMCIFNPRVADNMGRIKVILFYSCASLRGS